MTVCKTVCPILSDRCLVFPVCDIGVLWPNGWMDQDAMWYGGRLWPRPHCVRWRPIFPPEKNGAQQPPIFGARLLWPNSWMDQDETLHGGRPRPWPHCVRCTPAPLPKGAQPPIFGHVSCGPIAGWIKMPLGREVGLGPGHIVLNGDPAPLP